MRSDLWVVIPWMAFGFIQATLLEYERGHSTDAWFWAGVGCANILVLSGPLFLVVRYRLKLPLWLLVATQLIFGIEAASVRSAGAGGLTALHLFAPVLFYLLLLRGLPECDSEQTDS